MLDDNYGKTHQQKLQYKRSIYKKTRTHAHPFLHDEYIISLVDLLGNALYSNFDNHKKGFLINNINCNLVLISYYFRESYTIRTFLCPNSGINL